VAKLLQTNFTHGAGVAAICSKKSLGACLGTQTLRKSEMDKINEAVQMNSSPKQNQQQQTLRFGFISLRLSAATPKAINSLEEMVEEENT